MIDHKQASYYNYENASEGIAGSASLNYPGLEGKYTILEKVGRGAQGTVFKAETISGRIVAIKVFDFREAESWKDVDLLRREVDTLKNLDIYGVPKFIEFIEKEPYSYLVESYIEGTSLKDMIADGFEPTFAQIVEIFTRAMNILKNLHGQLHPVIHRDIKPGNLIVNLKSDDIRVWIVDFGTVAAARQRTNASTFAGTAGYLAPEQLFGKATPASDIYAMGMT
ncbi:MAG: serine/threonine protein kinase, partial [Proteobacteria bacterium]|nr:serine/threonine protein kinase [Pseudomonadota bacterium]